MLGQSAALISRSASSEEASFHSMLDWPEASHTSPTQTSRSVMRWLPSTLSSYGPPALRAGSSNAKRPSAAACTLAVASSAPVSDTFSCSEMCRPGSSEPQSVHGRSCLSTR
jgi:hypothetical protein